MNYWSRSPGLVISEYCQPDNLSEKLLVNLQSLKKPHRSPLLSIGRRGLTGEVGGSGRVTVKWLPASSQTRIAAAGHPGPGWDLAGIWEIKYLQQHREVEASLRAEFYDARTEFLFQFPGRLSSIYTCCQSVSGNTDGLGPAASPVSAVSDPSFSTTGGAVIISGCKSQMKPVGLTDRQIGER